MAGPSGESARLPGSASLHEQLDKLILVCLRDGRLFRGYLRSFDQYANLVLDNTIERLITDGLYCDVPVGIFTVRGENVMLLGEIDPLKDMALTQRLTLVEEDELRRILAARREARMTLGAKSELEWAIPEEFV